MLQLPSKHWVMRCTDTSHIFAKDLWGVSIDSWLDKAWLCAAIARLSAWQCEVRVRPGQRDDRCWTGWRWAPEVCIKSGW